MQCYATAKLSNKIGLQVVINHFPTSFYFLLPPNCHFFCCCYCTEQCLFWWLNKTREEVCLIKIMFVRQGIIKSMISDIRFLILVSSGHCIPTSRACMLMFQSHFVELTVSLNWQYFLEVYYCMNWVDYSSKLTFNLCSAPVLTQYPINYSVVGFYLFIFTNLTQIACHVYNLLLFLYEKVMTESKDPDMCTWPYAVH